ncbi:hypothetical protein K6V18_04190 [Ralstonia insidiosa]|uniref:hypothetical protein n=1 Tax=Ralstonia TaxID=48736 RepID=UPI00073EE78B|nr:MULTISPECIES: hypothetical protein [Ralstonia]MBY4704202.1 hypothetical protein [Ralstonia insidiosa]GAQ30847.1 hypothetical protein SAMD00023378_4530 [Ralstonia sp. NT80]
MSFSSLEEAEDHYNERIDDLNHEIGVVVEALRVLGVAADYLELVLEGQDDGSQLPSSSKRGSDAIWDRLNLVYARQGEREEEKTTLGLELEDCEFSLDEQRDLFAQREAEEDEEYEFDDGVDS